MNGNRKKVCKLENALNAMLEEQPGSVEAESAGHFKSKNVKNFGGVAEKSKRKKNNVEDQKRKTERAENLLQLIFWGPNWWS